jgi:hypothetical protein
VRVRRVIEYTILLTFSGSCRGSQYGFTAKTSCWNTNTGRRQSLCSSTNGRGAWPVCRTSRRKSRRRRASAPPRGLGRSRAFAECRNCVAKTHSNFSEADVYLHRAANDSKVNAAATRCGPASVHNGRLGQCAFSHPTVTAKKHGGRQCNSHQLNGSLSWEAIKAVSPGTKAN